MERTYKKHLLNLIENELANYHRKVGEHLPLVEALELYQKGEYYNIYNVLYKIEDGDNNIYYIAEIRITHLIDVLSTTALNQILKCFL